MAGVLGSGKPLIFPSPEQRLLSARLDARRVLHVSPAVAQPDPSGGSTQARGAARAAVQTSAGLQAGGD